MLALAAILIVLLRSVGLGNQRTNHDQDGRLLVGVPTVGVSPNQVLIPWVRAIARSITQTANNVAHGYTHFCKKHGLPFAIPSFGAGTIVIVPPHLFDAVLNRPESEIMAFPAQMRTLQPRYMMAADPELSLFRNPVQFDVVRKYMGHNGYGFFAAATAHETDDAFRTYLGIDTENPRTINIWQTAQRITSRTANRAFLGLPLCRNETLLQECASYAKMVYQGAVFIGALPESLKPMLAPVFGLLSKSHRRKCMDILVPAVKGRLQQWSSRKGQEVMPNDALQWIIEHSARQQGAGNNKSSTSEGIDADLVAQRLLVLQIVSTYTVALTLAPLIVNLYSSPRSPEFIAGLREECERVAASSHDGSLSSREAVDKLFRVDSAVRESMRVSPFAVINPLRIVGGAGLTTHLPGGGGDDDMTKSGGKIFLPPGTTIGLPIQDVQHDVDNYPDSPLEYDAFRFSGPFESPLAPTDNDNDHGDYARDQQELASKATKTFLPFSYGKHVCPGRWYATQTLKQIVAYMVMHYDVEFVGDKSRPGSFLSANLPPEKDEIRVVRRRTR
ncbi:cytochrome P450 [Microdochium trichocladiopsis]|uniref:Cytochrome P450 n=1 Tax=Microdochium trichocladiopsis TaxID=1682393 RepID=A0A9P9BWZ2_9PEZI|nr:cytochrome P450 [Microdochium trichocladiopsis]KAH7041292.1 cytochrome P450 [Microdochium trichocladiopsis]